MVKPKKTKVKTGQFYKEAERLEALRILAANNYNLNKTSKELNITRKTLKKWWDNHSDNEELVAKTTGDMARIAEAIIDNKVSAVKKAKEVFIKAMDRALVIIEKEKDLNKITNLANAVKDFEKIADGTHQDSQGGKRLTLEERLIQITSKSKTIEYEQQ